MSSIHCSEDPGPKENSIHKALNQLKRARFAARKWKNRISLSSLYDGVVSDQTVNAIKNSQSLLGFLYQGHEQPSGFPKTINYPIDEVQILGDADNACDHVFKFLGADKSFRGKKIPWHTDFKCGYTWPLLYYLDILRQNGSLTTNKLNHDIKIPYELSRFQHLPTLGKAYWLSGDEKYVKEYIHEISDWIQKNPYPYGVNWTCSMDIAIRAVNWIWSFYFFKDSHEITDEFLGNFLNSLLQHGKHIEGNLERTSRVAEFVNSVFVHRRLNPASLGPVWRGMNTNHYLSDVVGLVYLGIFFSEMKDGKRWQVFGIKELVNEMEKQILPDGVDYEGSISYHRLVAELFLSATMLCLRNNVVFPAWYMERLEKMVEFVMYYTKPDGTAPQVGDNDDGRLHILSDYGNWNRLDHRYVLSIGAALFSRPDFKGAVDEFHEEAFWLTGEDGFNRFKELPGQATDVGSKALVESGFYIMRRDRHYMIVDCEGNDHRASSAHKHNSALSFELFAYDKTFIVDPGAYIYTADKEMRNLFRSTKYHNAVVVDGEEQNRIDKDQLFKLEPDATVNVSRWESTPEFDILIAEHNGYTRLKSPATHRREIFFNKTKGYWIVKDTLMGGGYHEYDLYFHIGPMEIEFDKELPLAIRTRTNGANLAIIPLATEGVSGEILRGWVSYQYGVKVEAPIAKYSKKGSSQTAFWNILYPYIESIDLTNVLQEIRLEPLYPALVQRQST